MPHRSPIGVFDSGVGGLTVLRALREALPAEDFIYLGDTARLPYGTKSQDTVVRYSTQCAAALVARGVGCLVVACNTASASALDALGLRYPALPIIGVIEPGAQAAVAASESQHIAVIGTEGTISGGAYQSAIRRRSADARVTARACSMFVALAEEGWIHGPVTAAVASRYLEPIFRGDDAPDTLVLGCTHFPILTPVIRTVVPQHVRIIDSAATTAAEVRRKTREAADPAGRGRVTWLATDGAERFARVGSTFFGEALYAGQIEIIDL
ncbi:MAG: glutamate racemase [Steroidobacteraceae bacterium]